MPNLTPRDVADGPSVWRDRYLLYLELEIGAEASRQKRDDFKRLSQERAKALRGG